MPTKLARKKSSFVGRPRKLYKKFHYGTATDEEYMVMRQYTQKMVSMGILEKEWMGDAFKVLASIMLNTEGIISDGMLLKYKAEKKK